MDQERVDRKHSIPGNGKVGDDGLRVGCHRTGAEHRRLIHNYNPPVPFIEKVIPSFFFFFNGVPRFFPSRYPSFEGLGILVPHSDKPGRLTGGGPLTRSGSVKDNLLVFAQSGKFRLKSPEGNSTLELHLSEPAFIFISADQQKSPRFQSPVGLLRADTLYTHFSPLPAIQVFLPWLGRGLYGSFYLSKCMETGADLVMVLKTGEYFWAIRTSSSFCASDWVRSYRAPGECHRAMCSAWLLR
jgi:hypothetical protein